MRFIVGVVVLIVALVASLVLVIQHVGGTMLPGCGPGSGCAQATASAWGKLPGLGWPTSFTGLAYFFAMLIAWIWTAGHLRWLLNSIAIAGGVVSIILTVAMITGDYLCPYCLAVHVGNLVFVGLLLPTVFGSYVEPEEGQPGRKAPRSGIAPFATAVILVTAGLLLVEGMVSAEVEAEAERELEGTAKTLAERTEEAQPFTGRYLLGPEDAPIRLVVISDYQCTDCRRIEGEISQIMQERDDVSLSAKHFPMSDVCNPYMNSNMHRNACWAARAAEAAGIIRGNEGFWEMHRWLFSRQPVPGAFTEPELHQGLQELGYDISHFVNIMTGDETIARVEADIEEAYDLGIHQTPMIFINGVELKGWNAPNAVRRMVEQVAATDPRPAPPTADQPPTATEKFITEFRQQPVRRIPAAPMSWPIGAGEPALHIVFWGDYQEPNCARADAQIRAYMERHPDVRYEFRQFPFDQSCNNLASRTVFPHGCNAAKAALAGGQLGGSDAYWAIHRWLMQNQVPLDANALANAAAAADVDVSALLTTMESAEITNAIEQSAQAAKSLGLRSIPMIYVNGKFVPRWSRQDVPDLLHRILESARDGT